MHYLHKLEEHCTEFAMCFENSRDYFISENGMKNLFWKKYSKMNEDYIQIFKKNVAIV